VILDQPISSYNRSRLEHLADERHVDEQLAPLLIVGSAPTPSVLVERAWAVASRFVDMKPNEQSFLDGIRKGALLLDLLFPAHPEEACRLADHPAILWKIENVRKHLAGKNRRK
jgi:hypothetical protein